VKVRGRWVYLYRVVDGDGNTVDFRLSPKRDVAAAKAFLRKALRTQGRAPTSITLDGFVRLPYLEGLQDNWQSLRNQSTDFGRAQ
jgi:transposase-like protein